MGKVKIRKLKQLTADICPHCTQDCRQRVLILDSQIEALRRLEEAYSKKLAEMDGAVKELKSMYHVFRALYRISCQLLSKAEVPTETKGPQDDEETLPNWG